MVTYLLLVLSKYQADQIDTVIIESIEKSDNLRIEYAIQHQSISLPPKYMENGF